ncbi:MAG: acetyl-CoA hydrolase [Lachnospiraceae bacterium]|nr:acetyl-CoA hydrolase [Lachnospiraceae bacterium]
MAYEYRPMRSLIYVDCVREEYRHRLQHWLYAMHIPDSISKFGPYVTKYAFYNALPTPPEGDRFGTRRMQMTEHYWMLNEMVPEMNINVFTERMPVEVLRWQGMIPDDGADLSHEANMDGDVHRSSGGGNMPPFVFAHVPINWEEDFKGAGRTLDDGPNYRWQFVVEWPEEEAGEEWFYHTLVPYFQKRKEVNRFVSSKIYHDVVGCTFHRLVEMWFDGPEEWYKVAVEGTKEMEKPSWAQQEKFPFLKSNFNIVGMFLTDMANSDNLTQYCGYITMR